MDAPLLPITIVPFDNLLFAPSHRRSKMEVTDHQTLDSRVSPSTYDRLWGAAYDPRTSQTKILFHPGFCSFHCYLSRTTT